MEPNFTDDELATITRYLEFKRDKAVAKHLARQKFLDDEGDTGYRWPDIWGAFWRDQARHPLED